MTVLKIFQSCFLQIIVVTLLFLSISVHGTKRNIKCVVNPGYNSSSEEEVFNIVHITATGSQDIVHHIWSTYKLPSVIVARTALDSNLSIDYEKLKSFEKGAIKFSDPPLALIGLTLSQLWQMSYNADTASVTDTTTITSLGLENFDWKNTTKTLTCTDFSAFINMASIIDNEDSSSEKRTFLVKLSTVGVEQSADNSPHLIYNGNSTQMSVFLNNLKSNDTRTRYGMEIILFAPSQSNCTQKQCRVEKTKSMSDEFSPGIFSDIDIRSPCSYADYEKGSFLSWRPVAYTSPEVSVAHSTDAQLTSECASIALTNARSIAELYFINHKSISENVFNITFGSIGDGFYPKTEYTTWSLMMGTGIAIHTSLSVTAIIYLSVGLGALSLFFLTGTVFLIVRWIRNKKDDLLLSEIPVN